MQDEQDTPNQDVFLTPEELTTIKDQKIRLQMLEFQRQILDLELKNNILRVYLKYKLTDVDVIDETSGRIYKKS